MHTKTGSDRGQLMTRALSGRYSAIWIATLALFAVSPLIAPGSLGLAPLLSMLPFAAVLAIAAAGQTLVVQQRGLDLSVPGMIALGAVLVTKLPQSYGWDVLPAVLMGIAVPLVFGLISGAVVVFFRVMPLVVTLGMNSVLLGVVFAISKGTPASAPAVLNRMSLDRTLGIPNTLLIALVVLAIAGFIGGQTVIGRRLTAVGVSEAAARVVGAPVGSYQVLGYGVAAGLYGIAGILLAAYTKTPALFLGDSYLLPTVAAVVLGGTALTGGLASVVSSGVAALFLTQLGQLFRALGWPDSWQLIAQAAVLLIVVLVRALAPAVSTALRERKGRQADVVSSPA
ncbi:Ribose ABC transport system, permease protein RbsC (TC 3.A.1.2.1) [Leucobacter sp. 7(1)]|uniref:ABC transporter permease n=1 Tax=Leucobacter sp. 7(1) TaxID=1255613 RepID=UPI00097F5C86|nr:ABC transporter permease [Leucobacter sp. 7(1)]SJN09677.1 Ribose ABC transport system, permease protein RbsC (TC 3.A.1.2.1) [Leucobacter sp. 7(1)]